MIIHINEQYRVVSDPMNWSVEEKTVAGEKAREPGKVSWQNRGYFRNFEQCVNWLHNQSIYLGHDSDAENIFLTIADTQRCIHTAFHNVMMPRQTIELGNQYRAVPGPMGWTLEERMIAGKKSENPGEEYWRAVCYPANFLQCALRVHHFNVSLIKASSVAKILQAIKESEQTILAALERVEVTK